MNKTRLEMGFKDEEGQSFSLSLDSPREDLTGEEVRASMDLIIERDVFRSKKLALKLADKARIVRTEVEDFSL